MKQRTKDITKQAAKNLTLTIIWVASTYYLLTNYPRPTMFVLLGALIGFMLWLPIWGAIQQVTSQEATERFKTLIKEEQDKADAFQTKVDDWWLSFNKGPTETTAQDTGPDAC